MISEQYVSSGACSTIRQVKAVNQTIINDKYTVIDKNRLL